MECSEQQVTVVTLHWMLFCSYDMVQLTEKVMQWLTNANRFPIMWVWFSGHKGV